MDDDDDDDDDDIPYLDERVEHPINTNLTIDRGSGHCSCLLMGTFSLPTINLYIYIYIYILYNIYVYK